MTPFARSLEKEFKRERKSAMNDQETAQAPHELSTQGARPYRSPDHRFMAGLDPLDLTQLQIWDIENPRTVPLLIVPLTEGDEREHALDIVQRHVDHWETHAHDHPGIELGNGFRSWVSEASSIAEAEARSIQPPTTSSFARTAG